MNPALIASATLNHTVLDILYWINPAKANAAGKLPVSMRITLKGQRTEISTGVRCLPEEWNRATKRLQSVKWNEKKQAYIVLRESLAATVYLNTLLDGLEAKVRLLAADMRQAQAMDKPLLLGELRRKLLGEVELGPELLTAFEQGLPLFKNPSTRATVRAALKSFRQFLAPATKCHLFELSPEKCQAYVTWLDKSVGAASTATRTACLRTLFGRLYPSSPNPFAKIKAPKKEAIHRYVLSYDELAQLAALPLEAGSREAVARDIYLAQYYLHGSRVGVVIELTWEQVDWAQGRVLFKAEKGGNWHNVKIEPALAQVLRRYHSGPDARGLVFPLLPADYFLYAQTSDRRFQLRKSASSQVWRGLQTVGGLLQLSGQLHSHTARHTLATHTVQLTKDMRLAQQLLGHSNISMTERYVRSMLPDELDEGAAQVYGRGRATAPPAPEPEAVSGRVVPLWEEGQAA